MYKKIGSISILTKEEWIGVTINAIRIVEKIIISQLIIKRLSGLKTLTLFLKIL